MKPRVHSIEGGMSGDYFILWCQQCEEVLPELRFEGEDMVGVRLKAVCPKCQNESTFKLKVDRPLVPK
jgi:hypothetical protein